MEVKRYLSPSVHRTSNDAVIIYKGVVESDVPSPTITASPVPTATPSPSTADTDAGVGIIGSSDGPTTIIVSGNTSISPLVIIAGVVFLLTIVLAQVQKARRR